MAAACYAHPSVASVAECDHCGRGICSHCEQNLGGNTCGDCQLSMVEIISNGATTRLVCAAIGAFLGFFGGGVIGASGAGGFDWIERYLIGALIVTAIFGGFMYGWRAVKNLSQGWIMTPAAWFWFFVIQLNLAMLIGPFIMPFGVSSDIKNLKRCSEMRQLLHS